MTNVRAGRSATTPACALLAAALIAGTGATAGAAVYHVDRSSPACANSGGGTPARPFCTISAAVAARGGPGVTILVHPGTYPEQVSIPCSGAPGSPFELKAPAGGVIVDGADDLSDPGRWTQSAGDVWLAAGVGWAPTQVFLDGERLAPSTVPPASLPPHSFAWSLGVGLYVNAGGGNPAARRIRVGRRNYGFSMYGRSWTVIDGFQVLGVEERGFQLSDTCENVTLSRNSVRFAHKYGIQVVGGSAIQLKSNMVSDCGDHGIGLTGGATRCTLEDNESFRNARPGVRAANGFYLFGSPGNVLRRNRAHDNQDSGFNIQSGSNHCVATLNLSWGNGDHGYDHLEATGTIHVGDVAWGNYKDGFSIEGNSSGTRLHDCIATDNGLTTNEFDLWVDDGSTPGFVSDYNLFWNSTRQPPVKYVRTLYASVAAYSRVSHQDAQTIQTDPLFARPAGGDFHLLSGSPAIDCADSGVPHWPAADFEGNARSDDPKTPNRGAGPMPHGDRGAIEFLRSDGAFAPGSPEPSSSP